MLQARPGSGRQKAGGVEERGDETVLKPPAFDSVASAGSGSLVAVSFTLHPLIHSILVIESYLIRSVPVLRPGSPLPATICGGRRSQSQSAELGLPGVTSIENPSETPPGHSVANLAATSALRARKVRQPSHGGRALSPAPATSSPPPPPPSRWPLPVRRHSAQVRAGRLLRGGHPGPHAASQRESCCAATIVRAQAVANSRIPRFPRTSSIRSSSRLARPLAAVRRARRCRPCPSRLRSARLAWLRRA